MNVLRGALLGMVVAGLSASTAQAGHGFWSVGVNIGGPAYYRPYYYPYPYYYRPYGVYVAPGPVIVEPAPVVQTAPVVVPSYSPPPLGSAYNAPPATAPAPTPELAPTPRAVTPTALTAQADTRQLLQQLGNADERVRTDTVMQLGRSRASQAIDPLAATLAGDRSPGVREAAARALGLIGSPKALPALQRAAQLDGDRDVRRSAQFAMEVIQSRN